MQQAQAVAACRCRAASSTGPAPGAATGRTWPCRRRCSATCPRRARPGACARRGPASRPAPCASSITSVSSDGFSITMKVCRPELAADQRQADVFAILVAVADDQPARPRQRQHRHQLGLAARFQAEAFAVVRGQRAGDAAMLVDLDRIDRRVAARRSPNRPAPARRRPAACPGGRRGCRGSAPAAAASRRWRVRCRRPRAARSTGPARRAADHHDAPAGVDIEIPFRPMRDGVGLAGLVEGPGGHGHALAEKTDAHSNAVVSPLRLRPLVGRLARAAAGSRRACSRASLEALSTVQLPGNCSCDSDARQRAAFAGHRPGPVQQHQVVRQHFDAGELPAHHPGPADLVVAAQGAAPVAQLRGVQRMRLQRFVVRRPCARAGIGRRSASCRLSQRRVQRRSLAAVRAQCTSSARNAGIDQRRRPVPSPAADAARLRLPAALEQQRAQRGSGHCALGGALQQRSLVQRQRRRCRADSSSDRQAQLHGLGRRMRGMGLAVRPGGRARAARAGGAPSSRLFASSRHSRLKRCLQTCVECRPAAAAAARRCAGRSGRGDRLAAPPAALPASDGCLPARAARASIAQAGAASRRSVAREPFGQLRRALRSADRTARACGLPHSRPEFAIASSPTPAPSAPARWPRVGAGHLRGDRIGGVFLASRQHVAVGIEIRRIPAEEHPQQLSAPDAAAGHAFQQAMPAERGAGRSSRRNRRGRHGNGRTHGRSPPPVRAGPAPAAAAGPGSGSDAGPTGPARAARYAAAALSSRLMTMPCSGAAPTALAHALDLGTQFRRFVRLAARALRAARSGSTARAARPYRPRPG